MLVAASSLMLHNVAHGLRRTSERAGKHSPPKPKTSTRFIQTRGDRGMQCTPFCGDQEVSFLGAVTRLMRRSSSETVNHGLDGGSARATAVAERGAVLSWQTSEWGRRLASTGPPPPESRLLL